MTNSSFDEPKMKDSFQPGWRSPPGDTLHDIIDERGWTELELAERLGYTTDRVSQLIKGSIPLTKEIAIKLEQVVGGTVGFWLAREAKYRESC